LRYLEDDASGAELGHFLDAIATNFTRFFREPEHFTALTEFVQQSSARGQRHFKLWCAAASTGEEPYSMAMTLEDLAERNFLDFKILATDISQKVLTLARDATYSDKAVAPLTKAQRHKYFRKIEGPPGSEPQWHLKPVITRRVTFHRLNLAKPPFPMRGPFDVIFCRNVMIYFDAQVRATLVGELERLLRPGGLLALGHSETLTGINHSLEMIRPSVYTRPLRRTR
jgi:chemotaxis protein methyltransferase CheR